MVNALTIDVEEYFHAHAYERAIDRRSWDALPSRVAANTRRVLAILRAHDTRATFFVLGWVAERHPDLIREIAAAGHELATHGHAHELLYRQTRAEFTADLERALDALHTAGGTRDPIWGYRAPAFSLTDDSRWALDVLRAHGLRYDSSLLPLAGGNGTHESALRGGKRYGITGAARFAARLDDLWEFPVSTVAFGGRNWSVAGGGLFRLLPLWVNRRMIDRINAEGQPAIVYLHPWEFDPDEPDVPGAPAFARFRHRVNLDKTEGRLRRLLGERRFAPVREVFAAELAS
jgi:polysaccharide deacetylase family protein (PEP-CTERM system associated)